MIARKIFILVSAIFVFVTVLVVKIHGQPLMLSVSGSPEFNGAQVNISEAGNDFSNNIIESSSQTYLSISPANFWEKYSLNFRYRISVYKSDIYMHSSLAVELKRDNDGIGHSNAKVYNGENWQTLTNNPGYFFDGKGSRSNIPVSYRIKNISVLIPADDFETTVIYTVYED